MNRAVLPAVSDARVRERRGRQARVQRPPFQRNHDHAVLLGNAASVRLVKKPCGVPRRAMQRDNQRIGSAVAERNAARNVDHVPTFVSLRDHVERIATGCNRRRGHRRRRLVRRDQRVRHHRDLRCRGHPQNRTPPELLHTPHFSDIPLSHPDYRNLPAAEECGRQSQANGVATGIWPQSSAVNDRRFTHLVNDRVRIARTQSHSSCYQWTTRLSPSNLGRII